MSTQSCSLFPRAQRKEEDALESFIGKHSYNYRHRSDITRKYFGLSTVGISLINIAKIYDSFVALRFRCENIAIALEGRFPQGNVLINGKVKSVEITRNVCVKMYFNLLLYIEIPTRIIHQILHIFYVNLCKLFFIIFLVCLSLDNNNEISV